MDYEYEYRRYKDKVERQEKEFAALRGQMAEMKELVDVADAVMAAALRAIGADEGHWIDVNREDISRAVHGEVTLGAELTEDGYRLCYKSAEK